MPLPTADAFGKAVKQLVIVATVAKFGPVIFELVVQLPSIDLLRNSLSSSSA